MHLACSALDVFLIEDFARSWLVHDGLKGSWMVKCPSGGELVREAGVWRRGEHGLL